MTKPLFIKRPFKYIYFGAVFYIMAVNILIFLITNVFSFINVYSLSLNPVCIVEYKMFWQFFTYMFVHGNFNHVFFNMLGLLMFGIRLERVIGSKEFILFYFVTGIFDGVLSFVFYMITGSYNVFLMGASGALYAVMFAYAVLFPKSVFYIWGLIPVPAPLLVLVYTIVEIFSQLTGAGGNVAHMTHLFGFFAAWLYFVIRMSVHPLKVWRNSRD